MSINIDIAKLLGWRVEEFGILFYLYSPEETREEAFRSERYAWQWLEKSTGDFEHSHDACIRVCEEMGWEWSKDDDAFEVESSCHVYRAPTFALALLAALRGEKK